jgi:hypothetical protein
MKEAPEIQLIQKPVHGGWLVIAGAVTSQAVYPLGVTFVPDPNHEWKSDKVMTVYFDTGLVQ